MTKKYVQYCSTQEDGYKKRLMLHTKKELWNAVQIIKIKKEFKDLNAVVVFLMERGLTTLDDNELRGLKNVIEID
ncbi:MAG: hypothetical protein ACOC1P_00315 [Minisyncoccales bacterium]